MSNLVPSEVLGEIPVDLEAIGTSWGVCRVVRRELDIAALLYRLADGNSVVFLRKDDSIGRQRFSWAHELGHIVMSNQNLPQFSCRRGNKPDRDLEHSCDVVASEILMPRRIFCEVANSVGWSLQATDHLAKYFQVSMTAAAIRLFEFMDEPLVISSWGSSREGRLKRKWLRRNELAKPLKPDFRTRVISEPVAPIRNALTDTGVHSGLEKVLITDKGQTKARTIFTESLGLGFGPSRTILAFHYLNRGPE